MSLQIVKPADLPPFDENAGCPKCGRGDMEVLFHDHSQEGFPCWKSYVQAGITVITGYVEGEHLCRVCGRCQHGWCEATVETKPAQKAALRVVKD